MLRTWIYVSALVSHPCGSVLENVVNFTFFVIWRALWNGNGLANSCGWWPATWVGGMGVEECPATWGWRVGVEDCPRLWGWELGVEELGSIEE